MWSSENIYITVSLLSPFLFWTMNYSYILATPSERLDDALTVGYISARVDELVKSPFSTFQPPTSPGFTATEKTTPADPLFGYILLLVSSPCLLVHIQYIVCHQVKATCCQHGWLTKKNTVKQHLQKETRLELYVSLSLSVYVSWCFCWKK